MTTTKPAQKKPAKKATTKPPAKKPAENLEPVRPSADPEPLPGMEDVDSGLLPNLEVAVRRTIAALHDQGYIEEVHSAHTASAIELAQIIAQKHRTGRGLSTVGNDMRAMVDLLDRLVPTRDDDDVDAGLKKAMAEWAASGEL